MLNQLAIASAAAWTYLLAGHGGFWRTSTRLLVDPPEPERWPSVGIVIPARDEAAVLPETLPTLLTQDYPGELAVWLIDDGSTDGTGTLARALADQSGGAPLTVLSAPPLSPGWTGKLNAVQHGVLAADAAGVDLLLLTDADIAHHQHSVRKLVATAVADDRDIVSLMALLHAQTRWERIVVPAFVYFFAQLYPFTRVAEPSRRTAAAAGGCVLLQRAALIRAGGLPRIRGNLIDDVALARLIKNTGARAWLGFTGDPPEVRSIRPYPHLADLWTMVARTAYTQLRHSLAPSPAWACCTSSRPLRASSGYTGARRSPPSPDSAPGPRWLSPRRRCCGSMASPRCVGSHCLSSRRCTPP